MTSRLKALTAAYYNLSSLYKNPTRYLRGMAATDQDVELARRHAELLALFEGVDWAAQGDKPAIYFKVLALLYEVDNYRGRVTPSIERAIYDEPTASVEHFNVRGRNGPVADFSDPEVRTLWKAKVLCCVATIESRRKSSDSGVLLLELNVLEEFVRGKLHLLGEALPAWTTVAFVLTAQARLARQREAYTYVRDKLLSVVEYLDERAAEIIEMLAAHTERLNPQARSGKQRKLGAKEKVKLENEIVDLEDDLIFIRRKHTLAILFNFGLDNLQRGFLDNANQACQAARFQFRLHGHTYHRLFNELLIIAIKKARTSRRQTSDFLAVERELQRKILCHLEPKGDLGNAKVYLYGLRELAVIQHACGKSAEMQATLHKMERLLPLGPYWKSRISLLQCRAAYSAWQDTAVKIKDRKHELLLAALNHCEMAFKHATGGKAGIESYADAKSLTDFIKDTGSRNLRDTTESLITYGTVQLFLKKYFEATANRAKRDRAIAEALKSARAIIELSENGNPRLLAMGHLVAADAYRESDAMFEARRHLEMAKTLETQIQHEYVKDRRQAIEEKMTETLTLYKKECGRIDQAEDRLFGWYIGNCKDKSSIKKIADDLKVGRGRVKAFIEREGPGSPYYHLLKLDRARKKHKPRKKQA